VFAVVIILVSLAAMYLGAGFPSDVLGGILIGFAVAIPRDRIDLKEAETLVKSSVGVHGPHAWSARFARGARSEARGSEL